MIWVKIKYAVSRIKLVDLFLMLIMLILLAQSGYSLFFGDGAQSNAVDIIVRTSAASVFGYFLSGNFKSGKKGKSCGDPGCAEENGKPARQKPSGNDKKETAAGCGDLQIITVATIGIVSLALLIASRDFADITAGATATISQLRDFVSACVGFLVGCGKASDKS